MSILQGTTPSLRFKIPSAKFLVSDIVKLEFYILHDGKSSIKGLSDVTIDIDENSFSYSFTELETLAMKPGKPIMYQFRFKFRDGSIVGTKKGAIAVEDLYSEEVM